MGTTKKGFIISFNKGKTKLLGTVLAYGVDKVELFSLLTTISSTVFLIVSHANGETDASTISLAIAVGSLLFSLFSFLSKLHKFNISLSLYYAIPIPEEKLQDIRLSSKYKSIYSIETYNNKSYNERYIYSKTINHQLLSETFIPLVMDNIKYSVPHNIKEFVPFALKDRLKQNHKLFNGKSLGLSTDLIPFDRQVNKGNSISLNEGETQFITVKKTKYFDMLTTNHLITNIIKTKENSTKVFDGRSIYLDNNEVIDLSQSYLSDIIGVNTIAITNDNYVIIGRQGRFSEVSPEDYVPSGSGSLTQSDVNKIKNHKWTYTKKETYVPGKVETEHKENKNFLELIAYGASRELIEETNAPRNTKLKTLLLGYVRLLKRGGKPDFFCVSYIDISKEDIEKRLKRSKEVKDQIQGLPVFIELKTSNHANEVYEKILELENNPYAYSDKNKPQNPKTKVSLQLHVTGKFIKEFLNDGIDVFELVKNKQDYKK